MEATAPQMKPFEYYAQRYAREGFAVFPLKPRGKEPLTANGCKAAVTDAEQIGRWWARWPDANIGIATGSASGGLVVVDVDVDDERGIDGAQSLRLWESEFAPLPDTLMALTGRGGTHYFFRSSREVRNRAGLLEGVDVRGEGGYIVAPPSVHPNGRRYEWEASSEPAPAPLPEDLYLLIAGSGGQGQQRFEMPQTVIQGARNDTLFRLASSLQAKGLSDPAILSAVQAENSARCAPPLPDSEVQTIVASVLRYSKGENVEAEQAGAVETAAAAARAPDVLALLNEETFRALFAIRDIFERERHTALLRERARELKVLKDFSAMLSAYRKRRVQDQKQKGSNEVQFSDPPVAGLKCGEWICDDLGVRRVFMGKDDEPKEEAACPHPLLPSERLVNVDTGVEKLRVAFRKDDGWKSVIIERSKAASRQKVIELADRGAQVTSENAGSVVRYLSDIESLNLDTIPLARSVGRLGWVGEEFSPYAEGLRYDGEESYREQYGSVRQCGSREVWFDAVRAIRADDRVPARLMLAGSLASPMISLLGKLPFFINFWGGSGSGKTVAQFIASSVWGDPAPGKYTRSMDGTRVGLEYLAAFCCNLPLVLDELQTIMDDRRNFDQIIYRLSEGQGRLRGSGPGGLRQSTRWCLAVLTSGERPITSELSGGGAKNRVIEIECTRKLFDDPVSVANMARQNFGHAGPVWIDILQTPGRVEEAQREYDDAYRLLLAGGATEKLAMAAALCVSADRLAGRYLFGDDRALTPAELLPYLATEKDVDVGNNAYPWILSWVASNRQRFSEDQQYGECWGRIDRDGSSATDVWVIAQVLRDALEEAGFSYRATLSALARDGRIVGSRGGNTAPARLGGVVVRCVHLVMEDEDGYRVVLPRGLPF